VTKRFLKLDENLHFEANLGESDSKMAMFMVLRRSSHSSRMQTTDFKKAYLNEFGDLVEMVSWEDNLEYK